MNADTVYQIIGYVGSALIVASLSMKSILRLRLLGLAGAVVFCIYGILIGAIPIVITNAVIMAIHAYYLRKLLGSTPVFTVLEVRKESAYLRHFLDFYDQDIRTFLPDFEYRPRDDQYRAFILRDMVPAGLFICDMGSGSTVEIRLDYVIPAYRDLKVGRFLYSSESSIFAEPRVTHVRSPSGTRTHTDYLERMGFHPVDDSADLYELRLAELPTQAGRKSLSQ